jgi:hypothetical membrane protein
LTSPGVTAGGGLFGMGEAGLAKPVWQLFLGGGDTDTVNHKWVPAALVLGIAVPVLYFGVQPLAAPFFPGYSYIQHVASLLGSPESTQPLVFNSGAMLMGIAAIVSAPGFFTALRRLGVHLALAGVIALAVASCGLGGLWAGFYPLPDPRHSFPISLGMLFLPLLFLIALWRRAGWGLRGYLAINLALFLALVAIKSGLWRLDTTTWEGLFQRLFALSAFVPIGVTAAWLLRKIGQKVSRNQPGE